MPEMFSEVMTTFFSNFMPWLVFTGSVGAYYFYASQASSFRPTVIKDSTGEQFAICLFIVIGCIVCPFRSAINFVCGNKSNVNEGNNEKYEDFALVFPSDYDKENPLTAKKGKLRILDI